MERNIRDIIHSLAEYKQWKVKVFTRDNYTCQSCNNANASSQGIKLEAHHIKPLSQIIKDNNIKTVEDALKCKELWSLNNGATLCKKCHKLTKSFSK